jgi:hypothetical protein
VPGWLASTTRHECLRVRQRADWWESDEALAAMLAEAFAAGEAVPAEFVRAGRAAYAATDLDNELDIELAELVFDSADDSVTMRADDATLRALTYATASVTIELEIADDRLLGHVVPPGPAEVEVRAVDGSFARLSCDEVGWFVRAASTEC